MRVGFSTRAFALAVLVASISACGGYSSKGKYYPPAVPELVIRGDLSGAAETTVVSAAAKGASLFDFHNDGTIAFSVTAEASWVGVVTGVHIHRGFPGADGPAEIDVLGEGAFFDPVTRTASGSLTVAASLASEIIVSPDYFYLQVTTSSAPTGLVRAQLAPATASELHAVMRGTEESPVSSATARGAATFAVGLDRMVHYVLGMGNPSISQVTKAQIRSGAAGVAGLLELDLATSSAAASPAEETLTGDFVAPLALLTRIALDPASFYVEFFTSNPTIGTARGQLSSAPIGLFATLSGANELPVADAAARGGVTLELTSFASGRAIYAVPSTQPIATVTGAEVRLGTPFVNGPAALIDLRAGADFAVGTDAAEGAIAVGQTLYARLLGNPSAFYAEFLRAAAPTRLARGQLGTDPVTFRASLLGTNELPIVNITYSGSAQIVMTGVHQASFDVTMASPAATTLTGAHVHQGSSAVNGPILIDFLSGTGITTTATHLTGDVTFTGRTLAGLLAAPDLFYANVHTSTPVPNNGVARGQLIRVLDTALPIVSYATPVVYVTASPIAPNTPTNTGGAVASYSISPALPAGLSINATNGTISGTPTAVSAAANYTVTATNTLGSSSTIVNIKVNVAAPTNLAYTTPVTYVNGTLIAPNNPTSSGGAIASYSGTLPAGLTVDVNTGVISGTPTVTLGAANYTITGTNATSSTNATVNITVLSGITPPTNLTYASPVSYPTGTTITANTPSVTGGPVTSYSVAPALPAGLSLDTSTGVISGKPTATAAAANYTVTATNANAQSTTFAVNITVTLGAPAGLSYSPSAAYGYVTPPYAVTMNPSSTGGAIASYSITPALPAGITLNTSSGVISGTPTATAAQTTYTVTATNATGSTTATVTVTVPY